MTVQTVRGPLDASELGVIAPHEHLFIDVSHESLPPEDPEGLATFNSPVSMENLDILRRNPFLVHDNMILDDLEIAVSEMKRFKKAGGTTIVDMTNMGIKRNLARIREVSERSGVNVISGCGLYTGVTVPEPYASMSAENLAKWMIHDINVGDEGNGIRPGVIGEIGTSAVLDDIETRSLYSAAFTNLETGLPIYIHTYPWTRASLEAIRILTGEGVRPDQICICHLDVSFDHDYLERVFDTGVYAEFDDFGKEYYFPKSEGVFSGGPFETDLDRVRMIIRLIKEHHTDRLLLATDVCLKSLLHHYGGWGYDHVFTNISVMMENEGISREDMDTILMKNPTRFITSRR